LIIVGLFLLALVIRLVYLVQIRSSPFFDSPVADPGWHDAWAMEIAQGDWVGQEVFFRAPLYPYLLALFYTIFGHSYFMARLAQILLGSASCVLVYLVAKTAFNGRVGLVAGVVSCFYGVLIYFDAELLMPVLIVFLDLLLLWLLFRRSGALSHWEWALAGMVMGLSAVARPNILVFLPFIFLWLWLVIPGKRRPGVGRGVLIFLLVTCLPILTVSIRNYIVGKDLVFISSQGGINFYIGNAGDADGKISAPPGGVEYQDSRKRDNVWAASQRLAQQAVGRSLKPSQISSYWLRKAVGEIKERPVSFLGLMIRKLYFFWNGHEIESNQSIYTSRQWSSLLRALVWEKGVSFPFGILVPLATVGFFLTARAWKKHVLLILFIFSYMLSVLAFFVNFRFRIPVIPILIIYASYAGVWIAAKVVSQERRLVVVPAIVFLVMLLISNSTLFGVTQVNVAREHYLQALAYEQKGMIQEAAEQYYQCLTLDPYTVQARYNLAKIYRQAGHLDEAIDEFQRALVIKPDFAEAYNGLGITYAHKGEYDLAMRQFRKALSLEPTHGWAHLNLANIFYEMGLLDSALVRYRRAQQSLPDLEYIQRQIEKLEGGSEP
jgi:4-amino-4-deoxy-L-arabinose transferase-like glycosyltransferase